MPPAPECSPLAPAGHVAAEWSFAERYPGLASLGDARLRRRMARQYETVRRFCEHHVGPQALLIEQRAAADPDYVPTELLREACSAGLFSMSFPTWLGGGGVPFPAAFASYELIAQHCAGVANLLGVSGLAIACVMATFDPRALRYVANLVVSGERRGEPVFLATCVTEPGAGSDAEDPDEFADARLATIARRVDGGWRLSGTKVFISNGSLAALHVVAAFTDPRHRPEDLALFLVPAGSPGLSIVRNEHKLGQIVCPASEVHFDDVPVPDAMVCRSGAADAFARNGMANVLGLTRAGVGAFAAGVAEGAYRRALACVRTRTWQGQPMEQVQWVRLELAQLARRAQLARSMYMDALLAVSGAGLLRPLQGAAAAQLPRVLVDAVPWRAALRLALDSDAADRAFKWLASRQTVAQRDLACAFGDCAKVSGSDLAVENCQRAITLVGKDALRRETGLEKMLRDARLLQIYEGTNQVNMLDFVKRRVARQLGAA